jgi:hypothetical protein
VCVVLALFSLLLLQFARTPPGRAAVVGSFSHMKAVESQPFVDTTKNTTQNNYQMDDNTNDAHVVAAVETNVAPHATNQDLAVMDDSKNIFCDLIQFAVTGFAKCGTTSLGKWLGNHSDVRMRPGEVPGKRKNKLRKTAKELSVMVLKKGPGLTGYRNPADIRYKAVRELCPNTKHIVTVRHPVLWLESFYNYRLLKREQWSIKDKPNKLMGMVCNYNPAYVCAESGAFHRDLAKLGKTSLDQEELELLSEFKDEFRNLTSKFKNPILLIEISQLNDANATRASQLGHDMQTYLGLENPMPPIPHSNSANQLKEDTPQARAWKARANTINICDSQYEPIHSKMMQVARDASLWIRNYFLKSPDVTVSSPKHFEALLESWMEDPCRTRTA